MIDSGFWEGYHESRRCSRDTYAESYITKYASIRRKQTTLTQATSAATSLERDWYFIAEHPAPAPHLAHPEGCAALRINLSYPAYTVQCAAFVIGAKLSFEEERWRKNLGMFEELTSRGERRPALPEAAQERIIKRSVLAAAKATVNCWYTRLRAPRRVAANEGR